MINKVIIQVVYESIVNIYMYNYYTLTVLYLWESPKANLLSNDMKTYWFKQTKTKKQILRSDLSGTFKAACQNISIISYQRKMYKDFRKSKKMLDLRNNLHVMCDY
jgi:hypothetical protein